MFRKSDIKSGPDGNYLTVGSFIGSAHANPLAKFGGKTLPSMIFQDGEAKEIILEAKATSSREIVILFNDICPIPVSELAFSLHNEALSRVQELWKAIEATDPKLLPLLDGIIPLYCIFFTEDGNVIILSKQLGDIIHFCLEEPDSFAQTFALSWVRYNSAIKLKNEMIQLLYFAQTGMFPFADDRIRNTGAKWYVRLSYTAAEPKLAQIIDQCLLKKGDKASIDLSSVLLSIEWSTVEDLIDTPQAASALDRLERQSRICLFWKKKGWLVALIVAIVITTGYFLGNYIVKEYGPPASAGLNEEEIVSYYYQAQNELNTEHLRDTLVHGVKSPVENEVISLFVTRATRLGYEHIDCVITPESWIAEGRQPIVEGAMIYGTTDLKTRWVDDDTIEATVTLYSNSDYVNPDYETDLSDSVPTFTEVYVYEQVQQFDFIDKHEWKEISAINEVSLVQKDHFQVPYQTRKASPQ
ncbi:MAG: hypothetical protein SO135_09075 [Sphaerochaetaceae bacterium]|jgi:hypothetical protein|nr:hypothetical protein [Sphaerochaetaceae bacterium]NLY07208.1 hypothetical protein [Spirochaetales bacterium]